MEHWRIPIHDGEVRIVMTDRAFGSVDERKRPASAARVVDRPWVQTRQVHGADVLVVDGSFDVDVCSSPDPAEADALITSRDDLALVVRSADCATLALIGDDGSVAAVHAGWRGLDDDVIGAAASTLRARGAQRVRAVVGPHIGVECYEFSPDDLDRLSVRFGAGVVGRSASGRPALDVAAAVRASLDACEIELIDESGRCTACAADDLWSHRARGDGERQALVVWIERS